VRHDDGLVIEDERATDGVEYIFGKLLVIVRLLG
jgi:hypothetical protein